MRLDPKDVASINEAIQPSPLLSDELITAAQSGNPSLWATEAEKLGDWSNITRGQAEYWGASRASLAARAGVAFGIPSNLLVAGAPVNFLEDVFDFAMTSPMNAAELSIKFTQMGISIVTQVLSPIPIVGLIASAVGGIANLILGLGEKTPLIRMEEFPETQDYREEIDAGVAETVRLQMNDNDWNPLFLPRFGPTFESQRRGEDGKILMFIGKSRGPGVGYVPGTQRILGGIQAYAGSPGSIQTRAQNVGEWYPTAAQLMTAIWGQVNKPGPYLYFVHANQVRDTWNDYVSAAIDYVNDQLGPHDWGNDLDAPYAETIEVAELKAAIRPFFKSTFKSSGYARQDQDYRGLRRKTIYQAYVRPAMKKMRANQEYYLGKLTIAYIDLGSAAFQDKALLEKAIENRALLLTHPSRYEVRLADVIDDEYRGALEASGVQPTPMWKLKKPPAMGFITKKLGLVRPKKPGPIEGGSPGALPPPRRSVVPYLVAAGLGGGAYYLYKRQRKTLPW